MLYANQMYYLFIAFLKFFLPNLGYKHNFCQSLSSHNHLLESFICQLLQ